MILSSSGVMILHTMLIRPAYLPIMLFHQLCQRLSQMRQSKLARSLNSIRQPFLIVILGLSLAIACSGCAALPTWFSNTFSSAPVELTIRQVEPTGQPGVYAIAGNTSLPNQTQVTVAAIRYFQPEAQPSSDSELEAVYSILDRQLTAVDQGNWQTNLNLWQVAPDGQFQEAWQNRQSVTAQSNPLPTVTFLVTLDPSHQPANLQKQVENQNTSIQAALTRFTTDGEFYLQAAKVLPIALPTGRTVPPSQPTAVKPRQSQSAPTGSIDRSNPSWSQTDAPLSPDQLFR
jgi:hypothetical protein